MNNTIASFFNSGILQIACGVTAIVLVVSNISSCTQKDMEQRTLREQARAKALTDLVQAGANPVLANCVIERDMASVLCVQHQAPLKSEK